MSFHAIAWALDRDVPAREKLVLVCLANHADAHWRGWPSQRTIAARAGLSPRTVGRALEALEVQGIIRRTGRVRADGGRSSDEFQLIPDGGRALAVAEDAPLDARMRVTPVVPTPTDNVTGGPRQDDTTPPDNVTGAPLSGSRTPPVTVTGAPCPVGGAEPVNEPPTEPSSRNTPRATRAEDPAGFAEFWEAYPRRTARKAAVKAYASALKRTTPEVLLAGAQAYARATAGRAAEHIAHGASWLNGDRWEDAPETPAGPRPSTPSRAEAHQLQALANVPTFDAGAGTLFARPAALEAPAPAWPADPAQGWDR